MWWFAAAASHSASALLPNSDCLGDGLTDGLDGIVVLHALAVDGLFALAALFVGSSFRFRFRFLILEELPKILEDVVEAGVRHLGAAGGLDQFELGAEDIDCILALERILRNGPASIRPFDR